VSIWDMQAALLEDVLRAASIKSEAVSHLLMPDRELIYAKACHEAGLFAILHASGCNTTAHIIRAQGLSAAEQLLTL